VSGHAVAGTHGACPAAPPAQKKPAAHSVGVEFVAPAAHPKPAAAAAHGAHAVALVAFTAALHEPAAHGDGAADPAGQKAPDGHGAPPHACNAAAPTTADHAPAAHGVALNEPSGQKKPAGHATGTPDAQ